MAGRVAASLRQKGEEFRAAGEELHHLSLGPGPALEAEWNAAGLELPDLPAMRRYRLDRIVEELNARGFDGCVLRDPMNIRYATDTRYCSSSLTPPREAGPEKLTNYPIDLLP